MQQLPSRASRSEGFAEFSKVDLLKAREERPVAGCMKGAGSDLLVFLVLPENQMLPLLVSEEKENGSRRYRFVAGCPRRPRRRS